MSTNEPEPTAPPPAPPRHPALHRAVRVITAVEIGVAGLATAVIFVLVLVQAGQRYLPIDGWTWTGELARYCLVWLTFTATGVLVTRDGHIALQIVDQIKSERVVRAIHVLALAIVAVIGVGFAAACWSLIEESGQLTTPAMGLPVKWIYVLPLLGFISTAIRASVAAVDVALHGVREASHSDELAIQVNGPGQEVTR
ncbi:TRAP transporter small permease [Nocardioides sp. YIM 152588]|uniref:TRAP transporter small permease n=1 Tax=Nocardioides sp. YIM 152588 TaxID=3158259 RepID=UPI0032E46118